ncbi:MAG TPA: ABC transporter ATP-binding protein [Candidatus Krumholzibacteria bacterium]|nr:ABC transporter ATP-binding protein [Candidatus Krumholzibacteria bacterium]
MVLRLQNIQKSFTSGFLMRRRQVLHGLDLSIEAGEAYALLGANGAGKSTTLRILLGLARPDSGSGSLLGKPLGDCAARRRLGYLPENPTFHEQLTAREFLRYGAGLLGLGGPELAARIDELLERVELASASQTRLRKLSKGMVQRLGLAQALLGDPELLVLDEPMSGLDPPGRKLVRDLILEQRQQGKTVLFSTHILSDVEVVCTRAGILRDGCVATELCLDDLTRLRAESVELTVSALDERDERRLALLAQSTLRAGRIVHFTVAPSEAQELLQAALDAGGRLESMQPRRASLEDIYLEVARLRSPAAAAKRRDSVPAGGDR